MRIRPKSIRGKLLVAFFVAIAPVLGVQIADRVYDLARLREELQTRHRMAAFAVAASIGADMAWLRVQQGHAATQIALSGKPGATARRACEALDLMNIGLTRTQYARTRSGSPAMAPGTARPAVFSGILCNGKSKPAILVQSAIRSRDGGFGVLVTRVDERSLSNRLLELNQPLGPTLCAVVSRTGSVFGSPSGKANMRFERSYFRGVVERSRSSRTRLVNSRFCKCACLGTIAKVPGFDYWVMMAGPEQGSFLPAFRQQATWIGASAASVLLAAAMLFAIGNRLSRPVRRLARAAQALAVGDFRKRVNIRAGDELGVLAECFNSLGDSLATREAQLRDQSEVLAGMAEAARMASSILDLKQCARAVAEVLCSHLGAEAAAVFLKNSTDGGAKVAAHCHERPSAAWARLAAHTASSGDYLVMAERQGDENALLAGIPLRSGESTSGAIVARFRGISREDLLVGGVRADVLTAFGVHAAAAIANASLYTREATIAETLQQGLVSVAPTHSGPLVFAGRYVPAFDEARVGGDFYDVLELENGRVFVVMADVSGKGLGAAIHLAETKYMLRAIILEHPEDPGRVLRKLNDVMNCSPDLGFFVTAFCAVIDVNNHVLHYANAGHPPALLISRGGQMHTCLNSTGIPVGTGYPHEFPSRKVEFEPTDTLLLYTDGVTESRISGSELGVEGLHRLVFEAGVCEAGELVDRLYHALIDSGRANQKDDVALLAVAFEPCARRADETNGGQNGQEQGVATRQA